MVGGVEAGGNLAGGATVATLVVAFDDVFGEYDSDCLRAAVHLCWSWMNAQAQTAYQGGDGLQIYESGFGLWHGCLNGHGMGLARKFNSQILKIF